MTARWLWGVILFMGLAPAICADATPPVTDLSASAGMVAQLTLDGPIGPAAAEYFDDASKRCRGRWRGGDRTASGYAGRTARVDATDHRRMLACKIPVLVYVAPERCARSFRRHLHPLRRADRRDGPGDACGCRDAGEPGRQHAQPFAENR